MKIYKIISTCILLSFIAILLTDCSVGRPSKVSNSNSPYDWESSVLHPEFKIYHLSNDTSALFIKLNTAELLYTRRAPNDPFTAQLEVRIVDILEDENAVGELVFQIQDVNENKENRSIVSRFEFAFPEGKKSKKKLIVTDLNRKTEMVKTVIIDKSSTTTFQNFLLLESSNASPIFSENIVAGNEIIITSDRNPSLNFTIDHYEIEGKLPPPPFSGSSRNFKDLMSEKTTVSVNNTGSHEMLIEPGMYHFVNYSDSVSFVLFGRATDFPKLTTTSELVESIRYIASSSEYDLLKDDFYPKKRLDKFWLDCAGSKENARALIRTYYRRVQEANIYFSSFLEGWKTDRGLIHIIYGNPSRISRSSLSETWIYGEDDNINGMTFSFYKVENQYSDNWYELQRSPIYEMSWDRNVTSWRSGRIFAD